MRPHIKIPGTGCSFVMGPQGLMVDGVPIAASLEVKPEKKAGPVHGGLRVEVDPATERERELIGALILGACTFVDIDDKIVHVEHRRIVDALQSVDLGGWPRRLANAVEWCRAVGIDPVLCGRIERGTETGIVVGYLAGCVRSALRAKFEPAEATTLDEGAPASPTSEDDAENWER